MPKKTQHPNHATHLPPDPTPNLALEPITEKIMLWFAANKRSLPWRDTRDPYPIWLSEIILQQTRVAQGLPYWERFMAAYPSITALAAAPEQEVLRHWQGLGYYSRARNLMRTAKAVAAEGWPNTYLGLQGLPGVGPYTAAAIGSFAFGLPVAVVDGNVMRVFTRLFGLEADIRLPATVQAVSHLANSLLPQHDPATYNQAIMEFGALHCTPAKPACPTCPVQANCLALATGKVPSIPYKSAAKAKRDRHLHYLWLYKDDDDAGGGKQVALAVRSAGDVWEGLYQPILQEAESKADFPQYNWHIEGTSLGTLLPSYSLNHILSHQRLHIHFYTSICINKMALPQGYTWHPIATIASLPKPVPLTKFIAWLGQ